MAHKLRNLKLTELSVVDRPANQKAHITVLKADSEGDAEVTKATEKTDAERIADLEKSVATLTDSVQKANAERDAAQALAALSDAEKAFIKNFSDDEKAAFMKLSADERKSRVDAKKAEDEVFKTADGTEIRKSEVGAPAFAILKSQEQRLQKQADEARKSAEDAETARLEKRATEEFPNIAGTTAEKAQLLKAASKAGPEVVKYLDSVLKSAQELGKEAFTRKGAGDASTTDNDSAAAKLKKLADEKAAKENISFEKAYDAVMRANPALYAEASKPAAAA